MPFLTWNRRCLDNSASNFGAPGRDFAPGVRIDRQQQVLNHIAWGTPPVLSLAGRQPLAFQVGLDEGRP
jgi:hypothetical protein